MAAAESVVGSVDPSDERSHLTDDRQARLRLVGERSRPLALAHDRILPVLPVLSGLFPDRGLKRGSIVSVSGPGATSLALAVAAGPSQTGSWTAVVSDPSMGLAAAAEAGVALERLLVVEPADADSWAAAVAALSGSVDVVVAGPGHRRPSATRKISSRLRERGSVVVTIGGSWSPGADVVLSVERAEWVGLGVGHGVLRSRRVSVRAGGRGASARPRRVELLLPGPDGAPAPTGIGVEAGVGWPGSDIDRLIDAG